MGTYIFLSKHNYKTFFVGPGVVDAYNPSYVGGVDGRIAVKASSVKKKLVRPYMKKKSL
jgi:hypothetical protein